MTKLTSIFIFILVGVVAGWLAGIIMKGKSQKLLENLIVGGVGAVLAGWLFGVLGISLGGGIINSIISALIGAIIFLALLRVVK